MVQHGQRWLRNLVNHPRVQHPHISPRYVPHNGPASTLRPLPSTRPLFERSSLLVPIRLDSLSRSFSDALAHKLARSKRHATSVLWLRSLFLTRTANDDLRPDLHNFDGPIKLYLAPTTGIPYGAQINAFKRTPFLRDAESTRILPPTALCTFKSLLLECLGTTALSYLITHTRRNGKHHVFFFSCIVSRAGTATPGRLSFAFFLRSISMHVFLVTSPA